MKKICLIVGLFISIAGYTQKKGSLVTKLFFEAGFNNTKVYVIGLRDTLLSKKLSTNYNIGYALIFKLKDKHYKTLNIKAGMLIKKVRLHPGKFYRINIRDNELIVDEVEEEP